MTTEVTLTSKEVLALFKQIFPNCISVKSSEVPHKLELTFECENTANCLPNMYPMLDLEKVIGGPRNK